MNSQIEALQERVKQLEAENKSLEYRVSKLEQIVKDIPINLI